MTNQYRHYGDSDDSDDSNGYYSRYDKHYPWAKKGEQGRLFDWPTEQRKKQLDAEMWESYERKKENLAVERNRRCAELWLELAALWNAVKDEDMEDAAEMIYDFVREALS